MVQVCVGAGGFVDGPGGKWAVDAELTGKGMCLSINDQVPKGLHVLLLAAMMKVTRNTSLTL